MFLEALQLNFHLNIYIKLIISLHLMEFEGGKYEQKRVENFLILPSFYFS
jgi:hypothetical protein